ncbi:hypothetical protein [Chelativorans intermedius]|uniref:DUF4288 domain-containing protein n=1 Tax=Chelativorans intermedius TaxID=515947 RepID=A0ABV6D702_9HYPH|nr:hypothetical protein [Chelativorans intermedius]
MPWYMIRLSQRDVAADKGTAILDAYSAGLMNDPSAVEAAVYDRRSDDDGVTYFLSPTAARIMSAHLNDPGATECDAPASEDGLDLVAGDRSKAESPQKR